MSEADARLTHSASMTFEMPDCAPATQIAMTI
jgi:hypothetical protein